MDSEFQDSYANNVFELVGIFVTISSYWTTTWAISQFFEAMPWCISLGILYYVINIYFILTMTDRPLKNEEKSIIVKGKPYY